MDTMRAAFAFGLVAMGLGCGRDEIQINTEVASTDAAAFDDLASIHFRVWSAGSGACDALGRWRATTCAMDCPPFPSLEDTLGPSLVTSTLTRQTATWQPVQIQDLPTNDVEVVAVGSNASGQEFLYGCAGTQGGTSATVVIRRAFCDVLACRDSTEACARVPECAAMQGRWSYRRSIAFSNASGETFMGFPIPVVLDASRIDYAATASAGRDLRFFDSDQDTPLAYEIEAWNPAGESLVWVRVPEIPLRSEKVIWMYYGNPEATDGQSAGAVWSNGYESVYHLDGLGESLADSVGGHADALNVGTTSTEGRFTTGRYFNDTPDQPAEYIDTGWAPNYAPNVDFAWEAWFRAERDYEHRSTLLGAVDVAGLTRDRTVEIGPQYAPLPGSDLPIGYHVCVCPESKPRVQTDPPRSATFHDGWHHAALVRENGIARLFHNGGTDIWSGGLDPVQELAFETTLLIGAIRSRVDGVAVLDSFHGSIDEVRTSRVARSGNWLTLQVQSAEYTFLRFGPIETL